MRSTPRPPCWKPRPACSRRVARAVARSSLCAPSRRSPEADLPGRDHKLSLDQTVAIEQIATSGRGLDVLVGPAGTGKSTTMAGLRAVWETEHGAGSVLGLAPSAAAAEVLASRTRHRHRESGQVALRAPAGSRAARQNQRTPEPTQLPSQCLACPFAVAPTHHRRPRRGGPMAPPAGPAGDRGRGHPGWNVRPGRTGACRRDGWGQDRSCR